MKTRSSICRTAALLIVSLLLHVGTTSAEEVRVMTSGAFTAAYLALVPVFERSTKHTIVTAATSMGVGPESIPNRLQRGDAVDVVIVAADALDDLIRAGGVVAGSRVDLARSGIGMAVRVGAPQPDISSVEALRRTLVEARSVAYSASVSGDYLVGELFPRLGIADLLKRTGQRIERERVGAVVARGDAEIGFQQISELLPIPGIVVVGPLPPEVQRVTVFAAGVAASSKHADTARAFIEFLASPAASSVVVTSGMEPITFAGSLSAQEKSHGYVSLGAGATDLSGGVDWIVAGGPIGIGGEVGLGWVFFGAITGSYHFLARRPRQPDVFATVGYASLGSSEFSSQGVTIGGAATFWPAARLGLRLDAYRFLPVATHNSIPADERSPSRYWGVRAGIAFRVR